MLDTIRLLLFWDADQGKQDKEGCTPLHWAALRGHVEACVVLLHAGTKEELMVKDTAGFTPAQIAADRGHRQISLILLLERQRLGEESRRYRLRPHSVLHRVCQHNNLYQFCSFRFESFKGHCCCCTLGLDCCFPLSCFTIDVCPL